MKKKKFSKGWFVCAGLFLALGHWFFWYQPRVRPGLPDLGDLPAQLLLTEEFPLTIWVPYPHQNFGALNRLETSPQDLAEALASLSEVEAPSLPRFGPFSAPPARELVLAVDPEEERFFLAARVYPGLAVFARLAGAMAGNPWLGGGVIELRKGRVEIQWDGTLWSARTVDKEQSPKGSPAASPAPEHLKPILTSSSLGLARLQGPMGSIPEGWYRLGGDKNLRHLDRLPLLPAPEGSESPGSQDLEGFFLSPLLSETVMLVAVRDRGREERQALALFGSEIGIGNTGFALFSASPSRRLPLTGLGLAVLLGDHGYSGIASGWSLLATSELNFRQGAFLVPPVREGLEDHLRRGEPLELAFAAKPQGVLQVLAELTDRLSKVGPVAHRERVRLLAVQDLLSPLESFSQVRLAVASDRQTLRLELIP